MRLNVIGCSPAWPNPGGAHAGYLVEEDGRRLLLDCGPGVLPRLREHEPWPYVDAIAISHFHLDHWGDLLPWALGAMYGGHGTQAPQLWLPAGGRRTLQGLDSVLFTQPILEVFDVQEYTEGRPFSAAGFEILAYTMSHYTTAAYGFRVSGDGRTLAYSGDSGPCDNLVELARGTDLFLCEATLERPEPDPRGHLTPGEALDVFERAGAARLLVTHSPGELELPSHVARAYDGLQLAI